MSFHLHCRYLHRYIRRGDHILEAGAGAGRFTIELARLGADITVGDISPGQLELNRERVTGAGCEQRVVARVPLDITDLSRFPEGSFDGVVWEEVRRVVDTGAQYGVTAPGGHHCHMYSWEELKALLERHQCEVITASAANFLSVQNEALLEAARRDPLFWETLLEWETRFCEQSGVLDAGTHIIVVIRRT